MLERENKALGKANEILKLASFRISLAWRSWPNREAVEWATLDWVDWFNHNRLLGPIGDIPPAEAEAICHRRQERQAPTA